MFQTFISNMNMTEVNYTGHDWTWANNREGEGFMEERLDRFFVSPEWLYQNPKTLVHRIHKQSSDNCLVLFEDRMDKPFSAKRFYFDKRLLELPDFGKVVTQAWKTQ